MKQRLMWLAIGMVAGVVLLIANDERMWTLSDFIEDPNPSAKAKGR